VIDDIDPGQCDQTNHGTQVLVLNRENNELILICSKNDGQYQWKTPGGLYYTGAYENHKLTFAL
jgi:hypothetical protein